MTGARGKVFIEKMMKKRKAITGLVIALAIALFGKT